ncbi:MarR family winged helix-turn-helix transcriptional regulator [Streptomyces sp. URMC 129]|uniref:MarR family winged helix-turn-helix transcriptional regulator n=1 Tax=Streptomyces sp. URMC 129 TaxID=3423407 RepID=UPI003F1A3E64
MGDERVADEASRDGFPQEPISSLMAVSRLVVAMSARAALIAVDETLTLTLPRLRGLVVLEASGPAPLAVLARDLGVSRATALRTVAQSRSAGLIDGRVEPGGGQEVLLRLTPAGSDLVARFFEHRRREIAVPAGRLPAGTRRELAEGLRALTAAADAPDLPMVARFSDVPAVPDDDTTTRATTTGTGEGEGDASWAAPGPGRGRPGRPARPPRAGIRRRVASRPWDRTPAGGSRPTGRTASAPSCGVS